jgi:hypothetical protein
VFQELEKKIAEGKEEVKREQQKQLDVIQEFRKK